MTKKHWPILSAISRGIRAAGYASTAAGGGMIVYVGYPPFGTTYVVMGVFALIGGVLSSLGLLSGRWAPELLGLPLVSSAMVCLSLVTARDTFPYSVQVGLPSVLILAAFGILMTARFLEVLNLSRAAIRGKDNGS